MKTIRKTVKVPANRRLHVDLGLSPADGVRYVIDLAPPSRDEIRAKSRAAREKLRELTKDSTLTVEKFLEMKNADRALEAAIEEYAESNAL
jgi:hypothetical protein